MKAKDALELGLECGLSRVREATRNVIIHAPSMWAYSKMDGEILEMCNELKEMDIHGDMYIPDALDRIELLKGDN